MEQVREVGVKNAVTCCLLLVVLSPAPVRSWAHPDSSDIEEELAGGELPRGERERLLEELEEDPGRRGRRLWRERVGAVVGDEGGEFAALGTWGGWRAALRWRERGLSGYALKTGAGPVKEILVGTQRLSPLLLPNPKGSRFPWSRRAAEMLPAPTLSRWSGRLGASIRMGWGRWGWSLSLLGPKGAGGCRAFLLAGTIGSAAGGGGVGLAGENSRGGRNVFAWISRGKGRCKARASLVAYGKGGLPGAWVEAQAGALGLWFVTGSKGVRGKRYSRLQVRFESKDPVPAVISAYSASSWGSTVAASRRRVVLCLGRTIKLRGAMSEGRVYYYTGRELSRGPTARKWREWLLEAAASSSRGRWRSSCKLSVFFRPMESAAPRSHSDLPFAFQLENGRGVLGEQALVYQSNASSLHLKLVAASTLRPVLISFPAASSLGSWQLVSGGLIALGARWHWEIGGGWRISLSCRLGPRCPGALSLGVCHRRGPSPN